MDRYGADARLLENLRHARRVDGFRVPADANLRGHGDWRDCPHDRLRDSSERRAILE